MGHIDTPVRFNVVCRLEHNISIFISDSVKIYETIQLDWSYSVPY